MIVLSLVLVIAAAVLLVLGIFQDGLLLIYLSIASCLLAMGLLGVGVLLRRRDGADGAGSPAPATAGGGTAVQGRPLGASAPEPQDDGADRQRTAPVRPVERPSTSDASGSTSSSAASAASADRRVAKKAVVKKAAIRKVSAPAPAAPADDGADTLGADPTPVATPRPGTQKAPLRKVAKKAAPRTATTRQTTAGGRVAPASAAAGPSAALVAVKGLGPARLDALLAHFGSEQGLREASVEELTSVRGVGPALAQRIKDAVEG